MDPWLTDEAGAALIPHLTPLPGGHSGETFLVETAGERSVVRIYGRRGAARGPLAPEIDAAVLTLVRGLVPVPDILEVRRADPTTGAPGLMVMSHLPGRRLDEVLAHADDALAATLGHHVGVLVARLAGMPMLRPGMFLDPDLSTGPLPDGASDLVSWVDRQLRQTELGALAGLDDEGLLAVAESSDARLGDPKRFCLVHSDFNAKNVLVDPRTGAVTGLVDWEFAHAGSPFTDLGNLLRFDRSPSFVAAVLGTYADLVADAPGDLLDRARATDLFALVELAGRAGENPVATRAAAQLVAISRTGDVHAMASE